MEYRPNAEDMRSTFLYIGERCNVAGSSIYKKVRLGAHAVGVTVALHVLLQRPVAALIWHIGLSPRC